MGNIRPEEVPRLLRELKERLDMSRAELARQLRSSTFKLKNLENGRQPSNGEINAIGRLITKRAADISAALYQNPPTLLDEKIASVSNKSPVFVPDDVVAPASGTRRVSNSEIQTFKRCRRKWWLAWYRGLQTKVESLTSTKDTGTRIHKALAAWYVPEGQIRVDPRDALERVIIEDWTKIVNSNVDGDRMLQLTSEFEKASSLERAMIDGYVQWLQDTGVDENIRVIAPETYIEAPISKESDIRLIGKVDVRARRSTDNVRVFIDHKTVAEFTTPEQTLPMNEQMLHYHLLEWLGSEEGEERCDGALYNMLRRVKRTAAAKPPFYDRIEVRHNRHQLEAFKNKITGTANDMLSVEATLKGMDLNGSKEFTPRHNLVVYPTMTPDCRWQCQFFSVCTLFDDGSRIEDMLDQFYSAGDPLSYYSDEIKNQENKP